MRLTDEQILSVAFEVAQSTHPDAPMIVATVRRCLALAALPDAPSDYSDRERRGWEVSQPGELPK